MNNEHDIEKFIKSCSYWNFIQSTKIKKIISKKKISKFGVGNKITWIKKEQLLI